MCRSVSSVAAAGERLGLRGVRGRRRARRAVRPGPCRGRRSSCRRARSGGAKHRSIVWASSSIRRSMPAMRSFMSFVDGPGAEPAMCSDRSERTCSMSPISVSRLRSRSARASPRANSACWRAISACAAIVVNWESTRSLSSADFRPELFDGAQELGDGLVAEDSTFSQRVLCFSAVEHTIPTSLVVAAWVRRAPLVNVIGKRLSFLELSLLWKIPDGIS